MPIREPLDYDPYLPKAWRYAVVLAVVLALAVAHWRLFWMIIRRAAISMVDKDGQRWHLTEA
jgi:hypothetical protein